MKFHSVHCSVPSSSYALLFLVLLSVILHHPFMPLSHHPFHIFHLPSPKIAIIVSSFKRIFALSPREPLHRISREFFSTLTFQKQNILFKIFRINLRPTFVFLMQVYVRYRQFVAHTLWSIYVKRDHVILCENSNPEAITNFGHNDALSATAKCGSVNSVEQNG